jgi:predicted NBD/HSP70 family sugar kinase
MHLPEPTAEELAYGRHIARVHGVHLDIEQFGAGYALGRRQAESEAFTAGRKEAAAAIRAQIIAGARLPEWARAGAIPNATAIREWAARIAEGIDPADTPEHADVETPEQSAANVYRRAAEGTQP